VFLIQKVKNFKMNLLGLLINLKNNKIINVRSKQQGPKDEKNQSVE